MTNEPRWLTVGRKYLGVAEVEGPQHNPQILEFWKTVKLGGIKTDEVPWCAGFLGAVLELSSIRSTRADSARSYLSWGVALPDPAIGAIVVFDRGKGLGHVGFIVGRDKKANLVVLSGNQSDKVTIAAFSADRVIGYRWPVTEVFPAHGFATLPLITIPSTKVSKDES